MLETSEELDYTPVLDWFGLRFRPAATNGERKAWLGATTKDEKGRLVVAQVRRGTPALEAGLNVDDEIVAIGDYRVRPDLWDKRLEQYRPGQAVSMLIARRDQLLRLDVTFGSEPIDTWMLEPRSDATEAQRQRLAAWTGSDKSAGATARAAAGPVEAQSGAQREWE